MDAKHDRSAEPDHPNDPKPRSGPLTAGEVLDAERAHIDGPFTQRFRADFKSYLDSYRQFVEEGYGKYVKHPGRYDTDSGIRADAYPDTDAPRYGLALSGGGIRSASLAIGVIQALNDRREVAEGNPTILDKCRYLSTASGGGYTGSALTWFKGKFNVFPFGDVARFTGNAFAPGDSNAILSYIRQHGRYLAPPSLGLPSLIGAVLASILHSVTAYVLILGSMAALLLALAATVPVRELSLFIGLHPDTLVALVEGLTGNEPLPRHHQHFSLLFMLLTVLLAGVFAAITVIYGFASFFRTWFTQAHSLRVRIQWLLGWIMRIQALFVILAIMPVFAYLVMGAGLDLKDQSFISAASTSGLVGVFLSIWKFRQQATEDTMRGGVLDKISAAVVVLAFVISLLGVGFALGEIAYTDSITGIGALLALTLVFTGLVNINQISPHKMYRDRLMETFLKAPDVPPDASLEARGRAANAFTLSDVAQAPHWTPYHLINTNVILTDAKDPKYHGRCGDSFILSPRYCGSMATGYRDSAEFANGKITLATAMAISGAALNPHSGTLGEGKTTNPFVSFLLTFFGLRLGYWVINPGLRYSGVQKRARANYLLPGLVDLFGSGHKENGTFIELSDGGHFDNTGIYELIRRRVSVIVFSDGSADPDMTFDDFGNMVERVRVDFGVLIRFPDEEYNLCNLLPGSAHVGPVDAADADPQADDPAGVEVMDETTTYTVGSQCQEQIPRARRGFAVGDIVYPAVEGQPRFVGRIVYIKATVIPQLPTDIYAYKARHPEFPHQSTADQFFDERQFDSYRELGYRLTKGFLRDTHIQEQLP
ncbi:MAG: hypothetical protein ACPGU7_11715 [Gammaproteobacteria bacterium]